MGMTCSNLQKPNKSYLIRYCTETDSCGYKDLKGILRVPLGKYTTLYTDTFINTAIVYDRNEGIIGINRDLEKIYSVHVFDNGPDPVSEGLFRIINENKFGFADMTKIVIAPQFDFVYPFIEGFSVFIEGCVFKKDKEREHEIISGGKYGYIDKKGKIIIEAKFDGALPFFNGQAKVTMNSINYIIDTKGQIVGQW
jgi:hypothetical protein